jgi:hypothetical protein
MTLGNSTASFDLRILRFSRSPAIPWLSNAASQVANSSTDSLYRVQASDRLISSVRTASTTAAFRRATQCLGAGDWRNISTSINSAKHARGTRGGIGGAFDGDSVNASRPSTYARLSRT